MDSLIGRMSFSSRFPPVNKIIKIKKFGVQKEQQVLNISLHRAKFIPKQLNKKNEAIKLNILLAAIFVKSCSIIYIFIVYTAYIYIYIYTQVVHIYFQNDYPGI